MKMYIKTQLLEHQMIGVEKLKWFKVGALYMEMGTGKTRTALELIKLRADKNKINHIIWLCPCSCKVNLKRDISKHMDISTEDLTICGIETLSSCVSANNKLLNLVMSKECFLVVDESNLVKNPFAIRSKNIRRLSEYCKYKLILNGTPITRNIADLFSQWQILDWRILGYKSYYSFSANHLEYDDVYKNKIRNVLNTDYITDKINLYTYQVQKSECINLPEKIYDTYYFSLSQKQYEHYNEVIYDFLSSQLIDVYMPATMIYRAINALQQVTSGQFITSNSKESIEHRCFFDNPLNNPRIQCLLNVLKLFGNEKVIIWCKFTHEISDILYVLQNEGYKCCAYFGMLNSSKRQDSIDEFSKDTQIMVANKSCAGYGLNLQFCHNCVYYDNDYDWGTRTQSEDRLHRIGQNANVTIIDIVADSTIDERIQESLTNKSDMCTDFRNHLIKKDISKWLYQKKGEKND